MLGVAIGFVLENAVWHHRDGALNAEATKKRTELLTDTPLPSVKAGTRQNKSRWQIITGWANVQFRFLTLLQKAFMFLLNGHPPDSMLVLHSKQEYQEESNGRSFLRRNPPF